jgi:hypothetical protein
VRIVTLSPENLYLLYNTHEALEFKNATNMLESVIEKKNVFTKRHVERANSARSHTRTPNNTRPQNNYQVKCNNQLPNNNWRHQRSWKDLWKDVKSLKVKITRRKSAPADHDMVEIPPELIEAARYWSMYWYYDGQKYAFPHNNFQTY